MISLQEQIRRMGNVSPRLPAEHAPHKRPCRVALTGLLALVFAACAGPATRPPAGFAELVQEFSEPGGSFDTDNLVSNESAYLHAMGELDRRAIRGGVYLGVGPEQNFSYIAAIEPDLALIIDIRRDNLLLHLLFKALFESSENRIEYLARLFGRPVPADASTWEARDLPTLLAWLDSTPALPDQHDRTHRELMERIAGYGIPMTGQDRETLRRFHDEFVSEGLGLTFSTLGRPRQRDYPTIRRLYLETDLEGRHRSYLATEHQWRKVRDLERAGRVIPVVGNLAGDHALSAIGAYLRRTDQAVSGFYVSNVEFYLLRDKSFPAWITNLQQLPARDSAVLIRSWFDQGFRSPASQPGHFSSQHVQTIARTLQLAAGGRPLSYRELVFDLSP